MPLLRAEAEKLSLETLVAPIIEEIITQDATFAYLPFVRNDSKAYLYNREGTVPLAEFLDPNEAVPESAATFIEVVAKLRVLAKDVDIDNFLNRTMSDTSDQTAVQIAAAAKGVSIKFRNTFAAGNSNTNSKEFDGLPNLVSAPQTIAAATNGGAVTLDLLDRLKDMVPMGVDAFVMRKGTWRAIRSALRALGGATPDHIISENFGKPIPAFDGIPVLVNDYLSANEVQGTSGAVTCSVYGVRMNETDGLHGLFSGPDAGLQYELVGTVQNKDSLRHRLKWYVGMALKSTRSISRLTGVTNV